MVALRRDLSQTDGGALLPAAYRPRIVPLAENTPVRLWREDEETAGNAFLRQIKRFPILTNDEERALGQRMERGDVAARNRLIECNLRWCVVIARRYAHSRLDLVDDLISEAALSLANNITNFNWRLGWRVTTYLTYHISRDIVRARDELSGSVHVPVYVVDGEKQIRHICEQFTALHGREPTVDEIARALQKPRKQVAHIERHHEQPVRVISLDTPLDAASTGASGGGGSADMTVGESIASEDLDWCDPVVNAARAETVERVNAVMRRALTEREYAVVLLYYGTDERLRRIHPAKRMSAVAALLGISHQRAYQLHHAALRKLRNPALGLLDTYNWSLTD